MSSLQFLLIGFCTVGFFGSLSLFTPNTLWNDLTYFFRKDKRAYLKYSNRFHGKVYLAIGVSSLVFLLVSVVVKLNLSLYFVCFSYVAFFIAMEILLQVGWNRKKHK